MKRTLMIKSTSWDAEVFGMPTWELIEYSEEALQQATKTKGHHTIKVNPLANKRLLHEYGFYYCDTLLEPYCNATRLVKVLNPNATFSKTVDKNQIMEICHGAFSHGRFHRDFNLASESADKRYDNWLMQLLEDQLVYGLYWKGVVAGFVACKGNKLLLHALKEEFRGKGLAKYWWSALCNELVENGNDEVRSSISATNLAVFKLYASLGFSFNNPLDVYHCLVV